MRYRAEETVPMPIYSQMVYDGWDVRRKLAMEIIKEMKDEDFDKLFLTTVEERLAYDREIKVRVEMNI